MKTRGLLLSLGILTGMAMVAPKAASLAKKYFASDKLLIDLEEFRVTSPTKIEYFLQQLPNPTIAFNIILKLTNPTDQQFKFTKPFITVFSIDENGMESRMANSVLENKELTANPKSTTRLELPVETRVLNLVSSFPDAVKYFTGRMLAKMPSTRKLKVNYEFESEGFTINDSKIVNI